LTHASILFVRWIAGVRSNKSVSPTPDKVRAIQAAPPCCEPDAPPTAPALLRDKKGRGFQSGKAALAEGYQTGVNQPSNRYCCENKRNREQRQKTLGQPRK
jgi:hypothetical protein